MLIKLSQLKTLKSQVAHSTNFHGFDFTILFYFYLKVNTKVQHEWKHLIN